MNVAESLSLLIEKFLLHRSRRDITCRVYSPSGNLRTYSVILEGNRVRQQFYLETNRAEQYAQTGNEQYVLNEARTALRNLERMEMKRNSARRTSS